MYKVETGLKKISEGFHLIASILLLMIFMYIFADVVMRYLKLAHLGDVIEITGFLNVWMVFLSIGFIYRKGMHIRVDIITSLLSDKANKVLQWFVGLISILFCAAMTYKGIVMVMESFRIGQHSMSWHFLIWPFQIVVPLGFLLYMFEVIFDLKLSVHKKGVN